MDTDFILGLLKSALEASERAYAPYSEYRVGAALCDSEGRVHLGCNVENAAYGLSMCAERSAFFSAISLGVRDFKAIAVVSAGEPLPYPCGACRQVMSEFCASDFEIYIAAGPGTERYEQFILHELLPHSFS